MKLLVVERTFPLRSFEFLSIDAVPAGSPRVCVIYMGRARVAKVCE
jgi:hypothetical protein